jgi:eukaryotic-like serine/threonine-protein kinase
VTIPIAPQDALAPLRAALAGRYEIEREIGQGAFATVYLARDWRHERRVALKVLNADPTSEVGELRFIREIRLLARLQHPNILPLLDSGHVEALLYYVMPYVSGETLRARMTKERQLSIDAAVSIARESADALTFRRQLLERIALERTPVDDVVGGGLSREHRKAIVMARRDRDVSHSGGLGE